VPDFRIIPSIDILRKREGVRALEAAFGAEAAVEALRSGADAVRARLAAGEDVADAADTIESMTRTALQGRARGSLRPVINATGVVIHTNLGRAPLADAAIERVTSLARGYSNLEYDLEKARGDRGPFTPNR
jgi:L-seryl-tRNA(Ser) seleniumtransferase